MGNILEFKRKKKQNGVTIVAVYMLLAYLLLAGIVVGLAYIAQ